MNDVQIGLTVRAAREQRCLRQADVGRAAGVSQQLVSRIERGHIDHVSIGCMRQILQAAGLALTLDARGDTGAPARLRDERHAAVVGYALHVLRSAGWATRLEYSFSHSGERGSVDIVAWNEQRQALLILEAKSRLVDLQDLLSTLDRKCRVVPRLLAEERGWRARFVARVVVVPRTGAVRATLARHSGLFDTALPDRNAVIAAWLRDPRGPLAALWLVPPITRSGAERGVASRERVRARPRQSLMGKPRATAVGSLAAAASACSGARQIGPAGASPDHESQGGSGRARASRRIAPPPGVSGRPAVPVSG